MDANAKTYLAQVYKILDPEKTEIRYNTEWLDKLTSYDIVRLCGKYPLARMLEREDFRERLAAGQIRELFQPSEETRRVGVKDNQSIGLPGRGKASLVRRPSSISMHELLYPLLVAYDSVVLQADVELGATEQKFNLLIGREIQREYAQESQVAFTMPILVGLDGQRKMSKSLGNYVGITEPPGEMFGKLMSIPDGLMWSYWELLTDRTVAEIAQLRRAVDQGESHPMDVKMDLAREIIAGFHGPEAAGQAAEEFARVFRQRQAPEEAPVRKLPVSGARKLAALLVELGLAPSKSEAERLIKQGGVEMDGLRVDDFRKDVDLSRPGTFLLRAGKKKFLRLVVE